MQASAKRLHSRLTSPTGAFKYSIFAAGAWDNKDYKDQRREIQERQQEKKETDIKPETNKFYKS